MKSSLSGGGRASLTRSHPIRSSGVYREVIKEEDLMEEHSSHHNAITGEEAINRLKHSGLPHCYLTRYSQDKLIYVLTVYWKQRPMDVEEHFHLRTEEGRCKIVGKRQEFESIEKLLEHYEKHRISPSLPTIGKNYEFEDYNSRMERGTCTIS